MHNVNAAMPKQLYGVSDGQWKLTYTNSGPWLIDESADPLEYHNLHDQPEHAAKQEELQQALLGWMIGTPQYLCGKTAKW